MKYNIFAKALVGSALLLGSCDTLDYVDPTNLSDGTFWKTEAHATNGVVGVYTLLKSNWAFGLEFMFDQISDLTFSTTTIYGNIARGTSFSSTEGACLNHWQYVYQVIHSANTAIRSIEGMDDALFKSYDKSVYIAEMRFMRAFCYFELTRLWGDVPYYDETCVITDEYMHLNNTREDVGAIRTKILADLDYAAANLPVSWASSYYGRVTKGAAVSLRGKVKLYAKDYSGAASDFEDVIYNKTTDYGYALHDDYNELFRIYNGMRSPEMIFSLQSIDGNTAGYGMDLCTYLGNKGTMRNIASNHVVPSNEMMELYEFPDGKPFDWERVDEYSSKPGAYFKGWTSKTPEEREKIFQVQLDDAGKKIEDYLGNDTTKIVDVYRNRDPRCNLNIIAPYAQYLGSPDESKPGIMIHVVTNGKGGTPYQTQGFIYNSEGWKSYFCRKWIPTGNLDGYWGEYNRTPYEFPFIRLGDVVLMLSECYNEMGELDKAIVELNKIRARVNMPGLNNGDAWMQVSSKDEMTKRIQDERGRELCLEGHRYFDLKRWGIYGDVMKDAIDIFGNTVFTRKYESRMELWPISPYEIERSPALTQNPGW
ncbi:MAG: RagB/SusD family nutrient uptake outer membrane protein [Muribaculaceae bacterium]|nr:RagB/SusD family nutrient uptake outer membrane protein [Muribaculaceae bacterium]